MSMITLCPSCRTPFHVSAAQLSARRGRVRCGKCNAVFDGVSHLLDAEPGESARPRPSPQLALFDPARLAAEAKRKAEQAERAARAERERLAAARPSAAVPTRARSMPAAPVEQAELPEFLAPQRERSGFTVLWAMLSVLATGALVAQAAVHYRTETALLVPELRAPLEFACERLGCEVRLPRRPELMSIESSELQSDPGRPAVVQLNALIRNRAPFPQEYPALELTLTDETDRAVLRRVLNPAEYLLGRRPPPDLERGIAAGAELAVRVDFEARGTRASGYRLYLFYP